MALCASRPAKLVDRIQRNQRSSFGCGAAGDFVGCKQSALANSGIGFRSVSSGARTSRLVGDLKPNKGVMGSSSVGGAADHVDLRSFLLLSLFLSSPSSFLPYKKARKTNERHLQLEDILSSWLPFSSFST